MQLISKKTTITLNNQEQLKQLICLSLCHVLVVKDKSLHLYDIGEGHAVWDRTITDWQQPDADWKQAGIIEAAYHPKMKMLYLLVSMTNCVSNEKHLNWALFALPLDQKQ